MTVNSVRRSIDTDRSHTCNASEPHSEIFAAMVGLLWFTGEGSRVPTPVGVAELNAGTSRFPGGSWVNPELPF